MNVYTHYSYHEAICLDKKYLNTERENDGVFDTPVQHMLTAASLTLDILRVINNEVAVPHHREIHRQLTDFHPLVQVLEAEDGEKEGGRDREMAVKVEERQTEGRISMGGLGI